MTRRAAVAVAALATLLAACGSTTSPEAGGKPSPGSDTGARPTGSGQGTPVTGPGPTDQPTKDALPPWRPPRHGTGVAVRLVDVRCPRGGVYIACTMGPGHGWVHVDGVTRDFAGAVETDAAGIVFVDTGAAGRYRVSAVKKLGPGCRPVVLEVRPGHVRQLDLYCQESTGARR